MSPPASEPLSDEQIRDRIAGVAHWYHQIEIRPGITTPGINNSADTLRQLDLLERYDGLRVLDIGARDGFFSFELERRGAEVVAIDYMDPAKTGFPVARQLLGSNVEYIVDNVYNVTAERYGTFDLVLFLGVLYHLRDPLLALDRIWDVCRPGATLILETQLLDNALLVGDGRFRTLKEIDPELGEACLMQFYPEDSRNGDRSNYWAPNAACARGLLRAAGFDVDAATVTGARGIFHARQMTDPLGMYHRRLEKTTVEQAGAKPPVAAPAPALSSTAADARDHELARARRHLNSLRAELAGAREYIGSLEAEVQRKEGALVAALEHQAARPAVNTAPLVALGRRARRVASGLRRR